MGTNKQIEKRIRQWNRLMDGAQGARPVAVVDFLPGLEERPFVREGRYDRDEDWILRKYEIMESNLGWLDDDAVPYLDMLTGTEIFAEAFGCPVIYPGDNNPFAQPLLSDWTQITDLKTPRLWDSRLGDLFESARRLRERTGGTALLRLPDIQSPADIAALILKKESFYIGLIEAPELIHELIGKTMSLLMDFLDAWFEEFGRSFIAHYPDYYMEYGIALSEDEVGAVGAGVFRDAFLPTLQALSDRYGRIGIHCCANSRHQWEGFRDIKNLCLLNICQPQAVVTEAYGFFQDVCVQMHSAYGTGEIPAWKDQIPRDARVVYRVDAGSREDALRKLERLRLL